MRMLLIPFKENPKVVNDDPKVVNDELNEKLDIEYNKNKIFRIVLDNKEYSVKFKTCILSIYNSEVIYVFNLIDSETRLQCNLSIHADLCGFINYIENDIEERFNTTIYTQFLDQDLKLPKFTSIECFDITL